MFVQGGLEALSNNHTVREIELSRGDSGIFETVEVMKKMVHETDKFPVVKQVAVIAISGIQPNDKIGQIKAIFDYGREHIRYVGDIHGVEEITSPRIHSERILQAGQTYGDCDDFAVTSAAWLRSIGIKTRFTVVASPKNGGFYDHVRTEAYIDKIKKWIPLESTIKHLEFGNKMSSLRDRNFEI